MMVNEVAVDVTRLTRIRRVVALLTAMRLRGSGH